MAKDTCLICQIIEGKVPSKKVYEDDKVLAVLDVNGANPGHCFVIPKEHFPIMEQVPDPILSKVFNISNKISSSIFENLGVQGTNLFVANGVPAGQTVAHFYVNVIPRNENDNINLLWEPKQLTEEEMSTVELKIKEQTQNIGDFKTEEPTQKFDQETTQQDTVIDDDKDYIQDQINRIP